MPDLTFVLPGPIATLTGGFIYDRRIIEGLRDLGLSVEAIELLGDFPWPDPRAREAAGEAFAAIERGARVVVDGLALGALPEIAEREAERLRLIGLVHHPLALESGLAPRAATALEESERRALAVVDRVIVSSAMTARELRDGDWTTAPVSVVEPGVDPAPLAKGSGDAEGGDGGSLELLCVATLIPRKGHALLIEALAGLGDLSWRLTCVGAPRDPDCARALEAAVADAGLQDRVRFAGALDGAALEAAYAASDLFVLASAYEGFGMVITEAVMRGLPVVATAGGAIPETLPPGCGLLSPPGDAKALRQNLRTVLSGDDERRGLRAAAVEARESLPGWPAAATAFAKALDLV